MTIAPQITEAARYAEDLARPGRLVVSFPVSPFNSFPNDLVTEGATDIAHVSVPPTQLGAAAATARAIGTPTVFHLHWTSWVLGTEPDRDTALARLDTGLELIEGLDDLPFVWTVHNALPHECAHVDLEVRLRERIIETASVIHVMNPMTAEVVSQWYELPPDKVIQVPHPLSPPVEVDRASARSRLGLDPDRRIVAFLGQIRLYKGLDLLLDAVDLAAPVQAIVAGVPAMDLESASHAERAVLHPRVVPLLTHLDPEKLGIVAAAADAIILPYRAMLNSGIVEVARAARTPIIAPDLPHVRALIDPGTFYRHEDPASLSAALQGPLGDPLASRSSHEPQFRSSVNHLFA